MEKLLTTKDLAEVIGASESSLRRWTDSGAIRTSRTVGGHRRIPLSEAVRFIRESNATIIRPELLGLPEVLPTMDASGAGAVDEEIYQALRDGESARARGQILGLYLGGATLAAIFDGPVGRTMHRIGELWEHDARGILIEHRAADICLQAIGQLRQLLAPAGAAAPATVGGSPPGDPYLLPSIMAATVLAEAGYRETNFGPDTPFEVLAMAAREQKANLVWLSVSTVDQKGRLQRGVEELSRRLLEQNANLIIGGRHAAAALTHASPNVHVLQTMSELAAFVRGAKPIRLAASAP
jgi:MerR family transcriptional regulator, light-induced transcriptional regulator